ncbi:helix-turn-helix transcriptional regulator [Amycolatopsis minnesotensis]|uniref:LuxR C-terminal-related transcriptional regulator n=1 Tax=Amycolatopsis minnesotensis TaxID=337894 RepID=A0ABP5DY68_9PSEU
MTRSGERSLRELPAAARQGADGLGELLSRAIAPVVAHDALRLVGTSPAALFGAGSFSFWHGYDPALGLALLHSAYAGDYPLTLPELTKRPVPAGVLGTGDGRRDLTARRLLAEHGVGSALTLALRDAKGVWGALELVRAEGGSPFDHDDVSGAARLTRPLLTVLREHVTSGPLIPAVPRLAPGVLVVGADHRVRAATPQVSWWRKQLRDHQTAPDFTGAAYCAGLSLQTRRHAADPRTGPPLICGPPASHGRWVACHGQPLDGSGDVAIVVQAATAEQLLPSFCAWYGITAREHQVIAQLHEAGAPKQIARSLGLSVHTVNDHLKAVFRKTGAGGRDELVAATSG